MLNSLSLSSPKGILCLLILLTSFAAFGQDEVKIQNKTDCEIAVVIYWTNSQQVQGQTVTISPLTTTTVVGPVDSEFCRIEADFPGGVNPELIYYSDTATPASECQGAPATTQNACFNVQPVFGGSSPSWILAVGNNP